MASIVERLTKLRGEMLKLAEAATHDLRRARQISAAADALFKPLKAEMKAKTIGFEDANAALEISREIHGLHLAMLSQSSRAPRR